MTVTSVGDGDIDGIGDVLQHGVQQSRDVRQPIEIATSRVAQLRQLLLSAALRSAQRACI